jgi:ribonuclease Z
MDATILGTASPLATLRTGSTGTGILVCTSRTALLLDCGPGVTNRLQGMGVDIRMVETIVLTHHHWDHVADLSHFVLGRWEASQFGSAGGKPFAPGLVIVGPAGTQTLVDRLFGPEGVYANCIATRFAEDIGVPLYGTRGILPPFPPVVGDVREVSAGESFTVGDVAFTAAAASHCEPYLISLAYRLEAEGGVLVFSGDTAPCEGVASLAQDADILLHDCNVRDEVRKGLGKVSIHSTPGEVAQIAGKAGVRHVVAVHHGLAPEDREGRRRLRERIAADFSGTVTVAQEGDRFPIGEDAARRHAIAT